VRGFLCACALQGPFNCRGESSRLQRKKPPHEDTCAACHSARCEVKFLAFPIRALCSRARLGLGPQLGGRDSGDASDASWRLAIQFLSEENEYGRFCRYGDHNADGRRSKARPNEGGSRREREDPDGIVYSRLRPRWAGGGVQDALRACLRACGHASGQRTHDIVQRTRVQHRARHGGHVLHAWASR
jgi:hypothetical protein